MSDLRLQSLLGYFATLDKKQVASVKISFMVLLDVVRQGEEQTIVPQMDVQFKSTKD